MFEIRMSEKGEVVMTGGWTLRSRDKALQFLDAVPEPHVIDWLGWIMSQAPASACC